MNTLVIFLAIVIFFSFLFWVAKKRAEKNGSTVTEEFTGICKVAVGIDVKKQENIEKILNLLKQRGDLSNFDIREALGFRDRSVVRYMDLLEREGKVEQVGTTGRGVTYRLKA